MAPEAPKILITRPHPLQDHPLERLSAGDLPEATMECPLRDGLRQGGATVVHAPMVEIQILEAAHKSPSETSFHWIFLTSKTAAIAIAPQLHQWLGARPTDLHLGVVGPETAAWCLAQGFHVDFVPTHSAGGALAAQEFLDQVVFPGAKHPSQGLSILWPCAQEARPEFHQILTQAGVSVTPWVVYSTQPISSATFEHLEKTLHLSQTPWDGIVFTSPSAVHRFFTTIAPQALPPHTWIGCIGQTTAAALPEEIMASHPVWIPPESTLTALAQTILQRLELPRISP